ncbi:type I polyketide synthase, partial [Myceligenerans indicum]
MSTTTHDGLDRRLARTPLAIVGMSSLFPGSTSTESYWNNIVDRVDSITEVPADHWDPDDHYSADRTAPDKTYATRGGFLDPVPFHPIDFGIPPAQLEVTDVLQLLSLVVARDVLHDAHADQEWYDRRRTGVVLGVTGANQLTQPLSARLQTPALKRAALSMGLDEDDAEELATRYRAAFAPWEEHSFPGMLGNVVAGRVANRFDLGGMNMTVDAACASSLGALRAAAAELVDHRADTMITGGCDAENTIFMYLCFSKTPAFSVSGEVRPFDAGADGTLIGEGIGMLALRRLEDAERDGNQIYAVVRGIGSASDGRHKSIYAPAPGGQQLAVRRAYADADCEASTIGLVEAHGTGTAVGDATELSALSDVLREEGAGDGEIAVGSVKSQIGHTKAAAGAAGLIKLAMALQHRVVPPTINIERPADVFGDGPLHVSAEPRPWLPSAQRPVRRAGLSSFGFGGTDFHVVLEEHPASRRIGSALRRPEVRVWTASSADALAGEVEASESGIASGTPIPPGDPRIAVVAKDEDELEALRAAAVKRLRAEPDRAWHDQAGIVYRPRAVDGGSGLLFAGQGSQYVNPGLAAVLREPTLLDAFEQAVRTPGLEHLGRVAFPAPRFEAAGRRQDEERLRSTDNAQPVIGALSAGHARLLERLGLEAEGFAGHSFGELTALWAAGSIGDEDYFPLAAARGSAMARAAQDSGDPGSMAAVLSDRVTTERLVADIPGLRICNFNSPTQHVVGGPSDAIDALVGRADAESVSVVPLPVAAAFHTPIVAGARDRFRDAVADRPVGAPTRGTVYTNTSGAKYGDDVAANAATLVDQLAEPVDFVGVVEQMYRDGIRVFVECGPGHVLGRLVRSILGDDTDALVVALDAGNPETADHALSEGIAQLVVAGALNAWRSPDARPSRPAPAGRGPAVYLTGMNHVPDQRRAAYEQALAKPYELSLASGPAAHRAAPAAAVRPGTALVAGSRDTTPDRRMTHPSTSDRSQTYETTSEAQSMSVESPQSQSQSQAHVALAREQWQVHAAFLAGQQQVSAALLGVLQDPPRDGIDVAAVEQVVRQATAVGDTHVAVNRLISAGAGNGESTAEAERTLSATITATTPSVPARQTRALAPAATTDAFGGTVADALYEAATSEAPAPAPACLLYTSDAADDK